MRFAPTLGIAVETPALRFFLSRPRLATQAGWSESGVNWLYPARKCMLAAHKLAIS